MKRSAFLLVCSVLAPLMGFAGSSPGPECLPLVEKRRNIIKVFEINSRSELLVENQFGDVKVQTWNKNEIRIDIQITAVASSPDKADEYLSAVNIDESTQGNQIAVKTVISKQPFGSGILTSMLNSGNASRRAIKIDYSISMPASNPLALVNKFGDVTIPSFAAVLKVDASYGNLHADKVMNLASDIKVQYGNAVIQKMEGGKLQSKYGNLQLVKGGDIVLDNKFGKLNIEEINKLVADIDYSNATIGWLKEVAKVNLSYSGKFVIGQCNAENVDIKAAYSSIVLPVKPANFSVSVTHGNFRIPQDAQVSFSSSPDSKTGSSNTTKQYSGRIISGKSGAVAEGSNTSTTIKVISRFGDVSLKNN